VDGATPIEVVWDVERLVVREVRVAVDPFEETITVAVMIMVTITIVTRIVCLRCTNCSSQPALPFFVNFFRFQIQ